VYLGHGFQTQGTVAAGAGFCHRSGLKYLSHGFQTQGTVAAGAGFCHQSGLKYLSHGFQTQGTIAAGAGLCHWSGLGGATGVDLCTWAMDFRPKVQSAST
jgi:hypothetical protein